MRTPVPTIWSEDPAAFDVVEAAAPARSAPGPTDRRLQWGLRLPCGQVIWDDQAWNSLTFATVEGRMNLMASLRVTAPSVGWDVDTFVSAYGWVTRTVVTATHYEDIQDVSMSQHERMFPTAEPDGS